VNVAAGFVYVQRRMAACAREGRKQALTGMKEDIYAAGSVSGENAENAGKGI